MFETLILAPILINGNIVSQQVSIEQYLSSNFETQVASVNTSNDDFSSLRFALTEAVQERTKCYITLFDREFVESTGRTVYIERGSPLTPVTRQRYYYYADVNSDMITSIVTLDNSLSSLLYILEEMEEDAIKYGLTTTKDINNAILGYIRSVNLSYDDGQSLFGISINGTFYGSQNNAFIRYCEQDVSHGYTYNNYFGQFVKSSSYSSLSHADMESDFVKSNGCSFLDPLSGGDSIDLIHMFCSIDGIYDQTESNLNLIYFSGLSGTEHDMVSWLGDLLQACGQFSETGLLTNLQNANSFNYILNYNSSSFGKADYFADLDAFVISERYLNMGYSLKDSLYLYYYDADATGYSRETYFLNHLSSSLTESDIFNDFTDLVRTYLGYKYINGILSDTGTYYANRAIFHLNDPFNSADASLEVRNLVGELFINHVCGRYNG